MERRQVHDTIRPGKLSIPPARVSPLFMQAMTNGDLIDEDPELPGGGPKIEGTGKALVGKNRQGMHEPSQPPRNLKAFPDAKKVKEKGKDKRKRWKDSKGRIYEWDSKKGEVEIYDKTGKNHQGGYDPITGDQVSKADSGRSIEK